MRKPRGTPSEASKIKRERFVRLAPKRTRAALAALRMLRQCANPVSYIYTAQETAKIMAVIDAEVGRLRSRFNGEESAEFEL